MERFSEKQIAEHSRRKLWNEAVLKFLGLTLEKQNGQTKSIRVLQGELRLFYEWSSIGGQETNYELHKKLEEFLVRYMNQLQVFVTPKFINELIPSN